MQMNYHMVKFVVEVCVNFWLWYHSMQLFPNMDEKSISIMLSLEY